MKNFNTNFIGDDDDSFQEPIYRKIIKKSSQILQDFLGGTYWANTVGKTRYPGVYQKHLQELESNMYGLIKEKMTYREMEDFLVSLGYEVTDIRRIFKKITGIDPDKLEYMRINSMFETPKNIPYYNLGWGHGKSKDKIYFIMPENNIYVIFEQNGDLERYEYSQHLTHAEAIKELKKLTKKVIRYDIVLEDLKEEIDKNFIKSMTKKAEDDSTDKNDENINDNKNETENKDKGNELEEKKVKEEIKPKTPVEMFKESLPGRVDETISENIKDILSFVNTKNNEFTNFEVVVKKFYFEKKEEVKPFIKIKVQDSESIDSVKAVVTVILEITNKNDNSKKFALTLFFINNDNNIKTTDSIKGEDDVVYGFTEEGLSKYFGK